MKIISDVYRQTFPKKLRFDKACLIFHAELIMIARRHKHKKYIPKEEICDVLNQYEPLPGSPWLQLPVIRHVLLIRPINSVRVLLGWRSWLINRSVDEEFHRVKRWMTAQEGTGAKNFKAHRISGFVLRERFVAEVLDPFHVAGMYQRMMRWGLFVVIVLLLFIFASLNLDALVYFFLVRWCGMGRKEVLEWFRGITERHLVTEVPPAYKTLLPPPCVLHMSSDGVERYETKILELVSPDENIVVMAIPCPQVGSKKFFAAVGKAASLCDTVMMEGVSFEHIDRIVPAAFFPLRDNTFPALGLHHRFIDIVRGKREPPFLYPTVSEMTWRVYWTQFFVPFEWRCVYSPTSFSASKGEARMCWGRLRELIETVTASQADAGEGVAEPYVICLPWTLHQIVNLEASLIKYGFRVGRVFSMEWMDRDYMGRHFCDYYGIGEG
ncbi:hypothetical protein TcYC6_0120240 [Trypanosoma cruzi]|nr:hypothetical protein TcYC6_0120240 [Trypanosoma cruzi]